MFGYVRIFKPELLVKDYEAYRGVYCSVCRTLGKRYGISARFILNYDLTFFAVTGLEVKGEGCAFSSGRCRFNPAKKCHYLDCENEITARAADLAMLMLKYKLQDNAADSKGLKRLFFRVLSVFYSRKFKKAASLRPDEAKIISECISEQNTIENSKSATIDSAADSSAKALASCFGGLSENETQKRILNRLGYCVGRWVYLADAFDDLAADLKSHSFNPYVFEFGINSSGQIKEYSGRINEILELTAGEAAAACDLLEPGPFNRVLKNIIYDGLDAEASRIASSADVIKKKRKRGAEDGQKPL
ncbi:MAG: hypothetical protein GX051_02035 [Clostridiales bacterium]|nr:hypothetical protein [Clostridiales bacterium]